MFHTICHRGNAVKQRGPTTHLPEWPKSGTLTPPKSDKVIEQRKLFHCWWDCKMVHSLWESVWQFLIKFNILLPYNLAITLFSIYSKESKTYLHKNLYIDMYSSFIHNCQNLQTTEMSFKR